MKYRDLNTFLIAKMTETGKIFIVDIMRNITFECHKIDTTSNTFKVYNKIYSL